MTELGVSWSLRKRLAIIALLACAGTLLAHVITAESRRSKLLESRLEAMTHALMSLAEHHLDDDTPALPLSAPVSIEVRPKSGSGLHYQIWSADGDLLLRSSGAPAHKPIRPLGESGFGAASLGGDLHTVHSRTSAQGRMVVQVAEAPAHSEAGLLNWDLAASLLSPFALAFVICWCLVEVTLRAVRRSLEFERGLSALAAHEIRGPLAAVHAHAQLAAHARSPHDIHDSLGAIMQGVDRALGLCSQLLDLSRTTGGVDGPGLEAGPLSMQAVHDKLMSDLGPEAVERELQIRTRFDVPHVNANEVALLLIVRNLLANAIRYTPNGGCIEVGTSAREGMVTLSIDDSGPGIPVEQRLRAFQRFDRLGRTEPQGVGLGLSIVQALALNQGAVVDLLDSPLGGLRVEVRFDRSRG